MNLYYLFEEEIAMKKFGANQLSRLSAFVLALLMVVSLAVPARALEGWENVTA